MSKPSGKVRRHEADHKAMKAPARPIVPAPGELTLEEMASLPDSAINTDDMPELDEVFWSKARLVEPDRTRLVTLRVKQSVLEAFRNGNPKGYQTRMNAVLESYAKSILKAG